MTANRPKMPTPDPLTATTTAAAWLAAGVAIGLVQLDSAENAGRRRVRAGGGGGRRPCCSGDRGHNPGIRCRDDGGSGGRCDRRRSHARRGRHGPHRRRRGRRGGRTGCTGAGAGEGAGAFWAGGAAGAEAVAVVVGAGAGAGEPDDGGATGVVDSEQGPSGKQVAWAAPAAPVTTVKASMAAAVPGTSAPRRRGRRIMEYLCSGAGPSRAEFCPGYLPTVPCGAPNRLLPAFRRQRDLELADLAPPDDVAAARNEAGADASE
jgi:hypothetical protein